MSTSQQGATGTLNIPESKNEKTIRRPTKSPLDGVVITDPNLIEEIKQIIERPKKLAGEAFAALVKKYPESVIQIAQVRSKHLGVPLKAKEIEITPEDELDECHGCIAGQRGTTLKHLKKCKGPGEIDAFFRTIQYTTDRQVVIICKSLCKSLYHDLVARTRDAALAEFFLALRGAA